MRNSLTKRLLAAVMLLSMVLGLAPAALAGNGGSDPAEPEGRRVTWEKTGETTAEPNPDAAKNEPALLSAGYSDDDTVRVTIVLEEPSAIDKFYAPGRTAAAIASDTLAVIYRANLEDRQRDVASAISAQVLDGEALDVVWNLTLVTNAISANVRYGDIDAIRAVDGVKDVYIESFFEAVSTPPQEDFDSALPAMATSSEQIGTAPAYQSGLYGAGMRIAVIDTGTNPNHRSFSGAALEHALGEDMADLDLLDLDEIKSKFDQLHIKDLAADGPDTEGIYLNTKMAFNFNYVDANTDVSHENDSQGAHGSHVAGIATANRYIETDDGQFVEALDSVLVQGVAPDAQLLTMKVFGAAGGAYASDQFAAIEDAIVLGADVINLSIGTYYAGLTYTSDREFQQVLDKLASTDTVVTISAGNYGSFVDEGTESGKLYLDDVSLNTVGNPGAYTNAFTVASADNIGQTGRYLTANSHAGKIFYQEGSGAENPLTPLEADRVYNYIYVDSIGVAADYDAQFQELGTVHENHLKMVVEALGLTEEQLSGYVLVMNRGTVPFYAKGNAADELGAAGVIVINNTGDGTIAPDLKGYTGTAQFFSVDLAARALFVNEETHATVEAAYDKNGELAAGKIDYYTGTVTLAGKPAADIGEGLTAADSVISDYSAWGIPGSLELKPEITAPGGSIYSVNGNTTDRYTTMSGTSMAAPQVAGMAALVIQHIEKDGLAGGGLTARKLAQSLLMSTAVPMRDPDGLYYPVLRQGAGLANVGKAVSAESYVLVTGQPDGKVKAELGEDRGRTGKYTVEFTLNSLLSGTALTYDVAASLFTQTVDGGYLGTSTDTLPASAAVYVNGALSKTGEVTVPAGGSATVRVEITLDEAAKAKLAVFPNGGYVEGFITAAPRSYADGVTGVTHSIPLVGFYGSWTDAGMFDKGSFVENYVFGAEADVPYAGYYSNSLLVRYKSTTGDFYLGYPYGYEPGMTYLADRNSFDPDLASLSSFSFSAIRNYANSRVVIRDAATGRVYLERELGEGYGIFYHDTYEYWYYSDEKAAINWNGTDGNGNPLPDGTTVTVDLTLAPEYYMTGSGNDVDWTRLGPGATLTSTVTVDRSAPEVLDIDYTTLDEGYITVTVRDNEYVGLVALYSPSKVNANDALDYNTPNQLEAGQPIDVRVDLTNGNAAVGETFILQVGDYAGHISEYTLKMDLTAKVKAYYNFYGVDDNYWYGFTEDLSDGGVIGIPGSDYAEIDPENLPALAATYVDGYVFYADTFGDIYACQYGDFSSARFIRHYEYVDENDPSITGDVRAMAYNEEDGLIYITYRAYNDLFWWDGPECFRSMELVTLDPVTGEINHIARIGYEDDEDGDEFERINGVEACAIAIDDDGNFYGINMPYLDAVDTWETYVGLYRWTKDTVDSPELVCELKNYTDPDGSFALTWDSLNNCLVISNTTTEFSYSEDDWDYSDEDWGDEDWGDEDWGDEESEDITYCDLYTLNVKEEGAVPTLILHTPLQNPYGKVSGLFVTPDANSYDFNGDGETDNLTDGQALLDYVTGKHPNIVKTAYADLDGSGKIDTYDVEKLLHTELGSQRFAPTDDVTGVVVYPETASVTVGGTTVLEAYANPWFASDRSVVWSSSDVTAATVDQDGTVHALRATEAPVRIRAASALDPSVYAECELTVNPAEYNVSGVFADTDGSFMTFGLDTSTGDVTPGGALPEFPDNVNIVSGAFYPTDDKGNGKAYFMDSLGYVYEYARDEEYNFTFTAKSSKPAKNIMSDMTVLEAISARTGDTKLVGVDGAYIYYAINGPLNDDFTGGWYSMAAVLPEYGANAFVSVGYAGSFTENGSLYEVVYALDDIGNFWLLYFDFSTISNPQFESVISYETTLPHDTLQPLDGFYYDSMVVSDVDTVLFSRQNGETSEIYLLEQVGFQESDGTFTVSSFSAAKVADMGADNWPAVLLEADFAGELPGGDWDYDDDYDDYDGVRSPLFSLLHASASPVGESVSATAGARPANIPVGGTSSVSTTHLTASTVRLTLTLDEASRNGLMTVTYDPDEVTFVSENVLADIVSVNSREEGVLTVGWACASDTFPQGKAIVELVFERKSGDISESTVTTAFTEYAGADGLPLEELPAPREDTFTFVSPAPPVTQPTVTTTTASDTTETTAQPSATVRQGEASSAVTPSVGAEIVRQARENGSDTVVIAPKVPADVTGATVTIPGSTVSGIAEATDAGIRVETPVADVTLPAESLAALGEANSVAVSAKTDGEAVTVTVSADGETLLTVPGGVKVSFELGDGQTAVLVDSEGNETVIPKSIVENGLATVLLDGSATVKVVDSSMEFTDVAEGDWFDSAVTFASSHQLFIGTPGGEFAPNDTMDRGMLATVLWRLESTPDAASETVFPDVIPDTWYTDGVVWAAEAGIIVGGANGLFEPDRDVSRQEMALMLYRYAAAAGLDVSVTAGLDTFRDSSDVAPWARDAVSWAVSAGILQGGAADLLDPTGSATRAQVATVMERLVRLLLD